ncbi:MAG TPA: metal ABC transporter ATP-binding protein [Nitrososphaeraceae archaeon]|jgi:zinc transport system ATP-binding protein
MQDVIVSFKNLYYRYHDHLSSTSPSSLSLDNISFSVNKGDILGIIGPNGAGKSTLFRCMLGLLEDYDGEIAIFGHDIRKDRRVLREIGYIPQQRSFDQTFPATVQEIVSLGITDESKSKQRVDSAIRTVELYAQKDRRISELSGGQQQRVLVAKALVNDSQLLILDEPTTSIDVETQNKFYSLIKTLNQRKKVTILWSSHDLDSINKLANKLICINRNIIFQGNTHEFFANSELLKMYSESIMQAHMLMHLDQK